MSVVTATGALLSCGSDAYSDNNVLLCPSTLRTADVRKYAKNITLRLANSSVFEVAARQELVPDVHHQRQLGVQAPVELMSSAIRTCMYLIVCSIRFMPSTTVFWLDTEMAPLCC
uniref:Uncharacterized protein n=1 Tax=Triticum urartu TaxID=4572 RepID=A0A8R7P1D1_TRIUA